MTNPRGFLTIPKREEDDRAIADRVHDHREIVVAASIEEVRAQASRCMDCGVPFCHSACPLGNVIPEWNDLVADGELDDAAARLYATNNFPEITGRICPAPCEASCVLALEEESVTIKTIERTIADADLAHGMAPRRARARTNHAVAVVGSGPAGLAAAQQLARAGHDVTVFERDDRIGGLLRYGIPDFKLEKHWIDSRIAQMRVEGVVFRTGTDVEARMLESFDAIVLAIGARAPRDLSIEGRDLEGVHFAMEFLERQNRRGAGDDAIEKPILATNRHVIVIGGGDTGSDCVGTAIRQGAASVTQLEIMPRPPLVRAPKNPWPEWPLVFRTSSSQEEGAAREFALMTTALASDAKGRVASLVATRVERRDGAFHPVVGSGGDARVELPCDLALVAMGFTGPETTLATTLGVMLDARGNVAVDAAQATNVPHVFAAGDASRGQSLVVWAIADGRRAAASVTAWLATRSSATQSRAG